MSGIKKGKTYDIPENKINGVSHVWKGRQPDPTDRTLPIVALKHHFQNPEDDGVELIYEGTAHQETGFIPRVPRIIVGPGDTFAAALEAHDEILGPLGVICGYLHYNHTGGIPKDTFGNILPASKFIGGEMVVIIDPIMVETFVSVVQTTQAQLGTEAECNITGRPHCDDPGRPFGAPCTFTYAATGPGTGNLESTVSEENTYAPDPASVPFLDPAYRARFSRLLMLVWPTAIPPPHYSFIRKSRVCFTVSLGNRSTLGSWDLGHLEQTNSTAISNAHSAMSGLVSSLGPDAVLLPEGSLEDNMDFIIDKIVAFFSP